MTHRDAQPLYIYSFCEAGDNAVDIGGLGGDPVRLVEHAGLCAAVSDAPAGRLRPQRRLLAAHQRVLAALAESIPTPPAAFGLVADSLPLLLAAMEENEDDLRRELERVGGCIEMDVRVAWDEGAGFEPLVAMDETLAELRRELVAHGDAAPHALRVEVGRRVEQVLTHHRGFAESVVSGCLAPACRELKVLPPAAESELVRIAALVERDDRGAFDRAVEAAAEQFDASHVVRLAGPFAPHSFVDLHMNLSNSRQAA